MRITIVIEELEKMAQEATNPEEKSKLHALINHMAHIEAALIIPVIANNKLMSLIVLGNKKGGDIYTVEDLKLLEIIASQSATAFENARLYREVSYFNHHLQQKVDEATSELQKKNLDLKEANIQIGLTGKLKEDLLAMASHEFRTPISNIKNMLWMLQKQDFSAKLNDNEKQKFDRLTKAVERLDYVVRNINEMLNATNGNLEEQLHFDAVQIEQIIKEIIEDKEIEAKEALVNLVYREPQNLLPSLEADPVKLQYCLYELITNALKYTDKNGNITITTELQNNNVVIKISDTGKGIPPERIPTLFQDFDKIDVIHTTQAGIGLGLYIVAKIIELHKGKINVESTAGKGTTFTIELPAQKATKPAI